MTRTVTRMSFSSYYPRHAWLNTSSRLDCRPRRALTGLEPRGSAETHAAAGGLRAMGAARGAANAALSRRQMAALRHQPIESPERAADPAERRRHGDRDPVRRAAGVLRRLEVAGVSHRLLGRTGSQAAQGQEAAAQAARAARVGHRQEINGRWHRVVRAGANGDAHRDAPVRARARGSGRRRQRRQRQRRPFAFVLRDRAAGHRARHPRAGDGTRHDVRIGVGSPRGRTRALCSRSR